MSRGKPPELGWRRKPSGDMNCLRGHDLSGYNGLSRTRGKPGCRACMAAFQWAKKRDLFNDHPLVAAHAEELYTQYMAKDGAR